MPPTKKLGPITLDEIVWGSDGRGRYGVAADALPDGFAAVVLKRGDNGTVKRVPGTSGAKLSRDDLVKLRDRLNRLLET